MFRKHTTQYACLETDLSRLTKHIMYYGSELCQKRGDDIYRRQRSKHISGTQDKRAKGVHALTPDVNPYSWPPSSLRRSISVRRPAYSSMTFTGVSVMSAISSCIHRDSLPDFCGNSFLTLSTDLTRSAKTKQHSSKCSHINCI